MNLRVNEVTPQVIAQVTQINGLIGEINNQILQLQAKQEAKASYIKMLAEMEEQKVKLEEVKQGLEKRLAFSRLIYSPKGNGELQVCDIWGNALTPQAVETKKEENKDLTAYLNKKKAELIALERRHAEYGGRVMGITGVIEDMSDRLLALLENYCLKMSEVTSFEHAKAMTDSVVVVEDSHVVQIKGTMPVIEIFAFEEQETQE